MTLHNRLIETSGRGPGFDLLRIVFAVVVLLHHARGIEYDPLFHYSGGFIHFGFLAVAVFFAMSGFLVTPSLFRSKSIVDFTVRRILRIFPALIVIVLASMTVLGPALTTVTLASYFSDSNLYLYVKNVLTLTYDYLPGVNDRDGRPIVINGALWILHFEVLSYGMLVFSMVLGLLRRRNLFLIPFLVSYGIHLAIHFSPLLVAVLPHRFLTFITLFVYFGAGVMLFLFADRVPFSTGVVLGAVGLVVVALPFGVGAIVMPLCLSYIVVFCGLSALPGRPLLKHDLSYGVYLIHSPILVAFSILFPDVLMWWGTTMVVLCLSLTLAYLLWVYVEAPALGWKTVLPSWLTGRLVTLSHR